MTTTQHSLDLEADPQSVRRARRWVGEVLHALGRTDLVDAAELGVSELVTNAILHADPPITVRVRGTRAHPRVEVRDNSHDRPEVNVELADDENLLSTIGRGLGIVALYSATWGSEIARDGKTVWFEPSVEPSAAGDLSGSVFDLDDLVDSDLDVDPADLVTVRLLAMPVAMFAHMRHQFDELRRELHLLSLAHGTDYPVATELSELFVRVERERRTARGVERLDAAIAEGHDRADLEYLVSPTAGETMGRMAQMLERADVFCEEERLLAIAATPQQKALRDWYFGEFVRQASGIAPTPWPGGFTIEEPPERQQ